MHAAHRQFPQRVAQSFNENKITICRFLSRFLKIETTERLALCHQPIERRIVNNHIELRIDGKTAVLRKGARFVLPCSHRIQIKLTPYAGGDFSENWYL